MVGTNPAAADEIAAPLDLSLASVGENRPAFVAGVIVLHP